MVEYGEYGKANGVVASGLQLCGNNRREMELIRLNAQGEILLLEYVTGLVLQLVYRMIPFLK